MPTRDEFDPIPAIVPKRDSETHFAASRSKGSGKTGSGRSGSPGRRTSDGGAGIWARLFITASLVVALIACAWAWQLQEELRQAGRVQAQYEKRIGALEDLLSDTDETVNRSSAAMGAQIKLLDSEVRKLWDARKKSNANISQLQKTSKAQGGQLIGMANVDKDSTAKLQALTTDMAKLKSVAGDLERLMISAQANQEDVERVADTLNRLNADLATLNQRVTANEEWVGSINAFRRQISTTISQLQSSIRALQSAP